MTDPVAVPIGTPETISEVPVTDAVEPLKPTRQRAPKLTREEKLQRELAKVVASLQTESPIGVTERVASILNRFPNTRNSDTVLLIQYWRQYEPALFDQLLAGNEEAVHELSKLTSLSRARAKVQNTFQLFQASEEVQKRRRQLEEEERAEQVDNSGPGSTLSVYADESGKTSRAEHPLIVGSVWVMDSRQLIRAEIVINKWLASSKIEREFHFKDLKSNDELVEYQTFVDLMLETAPLVSFKKISVVKSGIANIERAFEQLFFRLVEDGIRHEDFTGRAVLPRRLFFVKDAEAAGSDEMLLSRLRDRLTAAFPRKGDRKLIIDKLSADDSRGQHFLQMADLFTSSLNRVATRESTSNKAKDVFADWFIERIASLMGTDSDAVINGDGAGDLVVSLSL